MTNTATVNNNGHHEESESKSESTDSVRSVNQLSSKANNILGDISHSVHKEENYVKINKISLNNVNSTSVKNEKSTTPTLTNHSSSKLLSDNNRGVKRDHSQMNNNNNNTKNDSQTGNNTTTTMLDTNTITSSTTQSFKDLFENVPDKSIVESWTVDDVIAFLNAKLSEFHRYESQFRVHVSLHLDHIPILTSFCTSIGNWRKSVSFIDKRSYYETPKGQTWTFAKDC